MESGRLTCCEPSHGLLVVTRYDAGHIKSGSPGKVLSLHKMLCILRFTITRLPAVYLYFRYRVILPEVLSFFCCDY